MKPNVLNLDWYLENLQIYVRRMQDVTVARSDWNIQPLGKINVLKRLKTYLLENREQTTMQFLNGVMLK
jgi:hypothetical protein